MPQVEIVYCTRDDELFHWYPGQQERRQKTYIEVDIENGTLMADWASEVPGGTAQSQRLRNGIERQYPIPPLTAKAANRLLDELAPFAQRVLDGASIEWDSRSGQMVGILTEDALDAEEAIGKRLGYDVDRYSALPGEDVFDDVDIIGVWDIDSAVNGQEVSEYDITTDTDDDRLEQTEREILSDLKDAGDHEVVVCPGLREYLIGLRDDLRRTAEEDDD
jgi:hypothetical protein